VNKRTAKITTSEIAILSKLSMAIPDNGLQLYVAYVVRSTIWFLNNSWTTCFTAGLYSTAGIVNQSLTKQCWKSI